MNLSDIAIRRPVFTLMLSMAIIVLGLLSFTRLPVELFPSVNFPMITVQVIYPGAAPEDIERDVTKPIEDAVGGISGISKLTSYTRESSMFLITQFDLETNLDEATNAIRDRVGAIAGTLPSGAEAPMIKQMDIGAMPVVVFAFSTDGTVNDSRAIADTKLRPFLEQVTGVGAVNVLGGQDREIQVDLDLDALAALGITPAQVDQRLRAENLSVPVGEFDAQDYTVAIRANGAYRSVEDVAGTVVFQTADGRVVRLGEVAKVTDGWTKATRYVRNNLQDAVTVEIVKKSGANTVDVCHDILTALGENVPHLPKNAHFQIINDQSRDIEANADEVWVAIVAGGLMAVLVILLFLLDLRGTMISAIALPTSIIGSFALMNALGFSINNMTLLGMSLAIGLLVDDAVVVRESITRRLEAGDSPFEAASRGTREITLAVLATTLSLVAVFVPVAFMTGMVGQFFKQFGLTMAAAVLLSLWVAFTLDPMLSARFSKARGHSVSPIAKRIESVLHRIDETYSRWLGWVLENRWKTFGLATASLVFTVGVAAMLPVEFVPKEDRGEVAADIRLPVGTSLEVTDQAARSVEKELMAIPGVVRVYTIVGHEGQSHRVRFRVLAVDKRERDKPIAWYEDKVREILSTVPKAEVSLQQLGIIDGLGDWPAIMLVIQGTDLDKLMAEGERLEKMMAAVPGSSDVRLTVDKGRPELELEMNRDLAADRGVPAGMAAMTARSLVAGDVVGTLRDGGAEADIRVRADDHFSATMEDLHRLPIASPRGPLALGEIANISMRAGASEIQHFNRMRAVTVWSQVANGAALGGVLSGFYDALAKAPLADGHFLVIDGQARDMKETSAAMGLAIGVAFVFIFMVLASQFESLVHPFTLMMSVPLAMVGAVLGLALTGQSISMGSQIGIILLMGVVTKNAILLVDGALVQIREGKSPVDAMRIAGPRRLRPIIMTSAAMALGMMPTALGSGIGSEFRSPMAVAVIGGVLSSTALTLLVVPVVFVWMEALRSRFQSWTSGDAGVATPRAPTQVTVVSTSDAAK